MKICIVENCNKKHHAKGYCRKHYDQIKEFGFIKRTKFDKNDFFINENDSAIMFLYNAFGEKVSSTIIDKHIIDKIKPYKWSLNKSNGYVEGLVNNKTVGLHRFILDVKDDNYEVDHRDNNKLNNQIDNLRLATSTENMFNRKKTKLNKSGVVGVHWVKEKQKWRAQIKVKGKITHLGYFDDIKEAEKVRIEYEIKLQKEFRCDNKYED